jgi:hypothetical protein
MSEKDLEQRPAGTVIRCGTMLALTRPQVLLFYPQGKATCAKRDQPRQSVIVAAQIQTRFVGGAVLKFQTRRKILSCGRGRGPTPSASAPASGASRPPRNVSISGEIDVKRI